MDTDDKYFELIEQGDFINANNMRSGFFSNEINEASDGELFSRVWELHDRENWNSIDRFMGREYLCDWLDFKTSKGELTDRILVFHREDKTDLDAEDAPLDNIIRDKVNSFLTHNEICDLYDLVYLCSERFQELSPDIKGLLHTILDFNDERHLDYILATQYDPSIDESDLRERYAASCDRLGLDMTKDPRALVS